MNKIINFTFIDNYFDSNVFKFINKTLEKIMTFLDMTLTLNETTTEITYPSIGFTTDQWITRIGQY